MTSRSFASVGWVATVAGAALGCYLVSLRVAAERAALEGVQSEIVLAQRDIRLLQTEIGTRGRLAQLERWNVKVLALSAPKAEQFLDGGFALAKLTTPRREIDLGAPVVLASARAPISKPIADAGADDGASPRSAAGGLLYTASLRRELAVRNPLPARPAGRQSPAAGSAHSSASPKASPKASPRAESRPQAMRDQAATSAPQATGQADPLAPISTDAPGKDSSTLQ